ncbi:MAG: pyruvate, water dikinase regulatory protein [Patescibacteria group bacterium]|nr:pyruvate, water dikinase regulatory protein [Patescibacteria group bacterium]
MLIIYVLSDSTGETASRLVQAALAQFQDAPVKIVRRANIRSEEQVKEVVREAAGENGHALLLYSLVSAQLRRLVLEEGRLKNVDSLDVLGPVLERLTTHLSLAPQEKPGLYRQLLEARERVIDAVDFAFHHDDGQNVDDLQRAEVVLVGVSRVMKTPTMLYLAYRGWFAGNVPLILDMAPPEPLLAVPARRVVYLRMSPERLLELRRVRAERTGLPIESYATLQCVRRDLDYGRDLVRRHGWMTVDVTGKSVEEASREIIALLSSE